MTIIEKQNIKQFHAVRLEEKSFSRSKMMGWTTKQAQQIRFKAIASLYNFNNVSVLDLGCGDGDFKAFLDTSFSNFHYLGLDLQDAFISYAKARFKEDENTWFFNTDFTNCQLPKVDVVVACGALSYKSNVPDYYIKTIERFYTAANKVLIFNMLDNKFFESGNIIIAHNKEKVYAQCQEICNNVTIKTGYLENDFTVIMRKDSK